MRAVPMRAVVVSSSSSFALASHFLRRISRITPYPIPFSSPTTSLSSAAAVSPCYGGRRQTSASLTISSYSDELRRGYSLADLAVARLEWQRDGSGYGGVRRRRFCSVRATEASDSGSVDSPMMQAMEKKTLGFSTNNRSKCLLGIWMGQSFKIKEQLDADVVIVKDAYGDGRHVSIDVVSKAFEGKSAVNRQRMVYKAIWEELQSTVHAVDQMVTRTPTEVNAEK